MRRILLLPIAILGRAISICSICYLRWSGIQWKGRDLLPIALTQNSGILRELYRRIAGQGTPTCSVIICMNIVTHIGR